MVASVARTASPGSLQASAASFGRIEGEWRGRSPLPRARTELTAVYLDSRVFAFGGCRRGRTVDDAEVYDVRADKWENIRPLPLPLDHTIAVAVDDEVFLLGGSLSATNEVAGDDLAEMMKSTNWDFAPRAAVYRYDPQTDAYSKSAPMPLPRLGHSAVRCGDFIYVVGGQGPNPSVMMRYEIKADRWDYLPGMPTFREHQAMVAYEDRIYVIGGRWPDPRDPNSNFMIGQLNTGANEVYDPGSGLWGSLPALPTPRGAGYGALLDGLIYVAGGEVLDSPDRLTFGEVEAFDPKTSVWYLAPRLPTPRHGLGVVSDGRSLFAIGGGPKAAWDECDAVEEFIPARIELPRNKVQEQ